MPIHSKFTLGTKHESNVLADKLAVISHFNSEECKSLLNIYETLASSGKVDRLKIREFLHTCFDITDDVMLDLTYRAFDKNNDGVVDEQEFIVGLSQMIRGDMDELKEYCYYVFDVNGDRSLAREELQQCLKGCFYSGNGLDNDEIEDAEKDIIEICMKKLDINKDGQVTFDDFCNAVRGDALLLESIGPCLPSTESMATFLSTLTENYRTYATHWTPGSKYRSKSSTINSYYLTKFVKDHLKEREKDNNKKQHRGGYDHEFGIRRTTVDYDREKIKLARHFHKAGKVRKEKWEGS